MPVQCTPPTSLLRPDLAVTPSTLTDPRSDAGPTIAITGPVRHSESVDNKGQEEHETVQGWEKAAPGGGETAANANRGHPELYLASTVSYCTLCGTWVARLLAHRHVPLAAGYLLCGS